MPYLKYLGSPWFIINVYVMVANTGKSEYIDLNVIMPIIRYAIIKVTVHILFININKIIR